MPSKGRKKIEDLANIEVEHLLGMVTHAPLVKLRAESEQTVLVGQLETDSARRIAQHLIESAARAEYEADLLGEAKRIGMTEEVLGQLITMVRAGEARRQNGNGGNGTTTNGNES